MAAKKKLKSKSQRKIESDQRMKTLLMRRELDKEFAFKSVHKKKKRTSSGRSMSKAKGNRRSR